MVAVFVILTIAAFLVADTIIRRVEAKRQLQPEPARLAGYPIPAYTFEGLSVPDGMFVDRGHTWVELEPSGRAHVGVDDFSQRVIGRIDEVELPEVGQEVRRGEKLFAVHQGQRTAVFTSPLDGVISSVNQDLARHAEAIKTDPYEQGWICSMRPNNLARNLKRLFIAEETRDWLHQEMRRFQEFIAARPLEHTALGHVLQDGGQPTGGVLELMDEETWHLFTNEFLRGGAAETEPE